MKAVILKITIAVLQSKPVQDFLKNIFYFIGGFFLFISLMVSIIINPFAADPLSSPYPIAIDEVSREDDIHDYFDARIIQAIEVELFGDINNAKVSDIKHRIRKYYTKQIRVEFECFDEEGESMICIKYETVFRSFNESINELKKDYKITDKSIENIRVYINFLSRGTFSGSLPIFSGEFALPSSTGTLTCRIGCYAEHIGLDIGVNRGTDIYTIADGVVIYTDNSYAEGDGRGSYGNLVILAHNIDGIPMISIYGHLQDVLVNIGTPVSKGDLIAKSGNTGVSTGPHLHLEIISNTNEMVWDKEFRKNNFIDPVELLRLENYW